MKKRSSKPFSLSIRMNFNFIFVSYGKSNPSLALMRFDNKKSIFYNVIDLHIKWKCHRPIMVTDLLAERYYMSGFIYVKNNSRQTPLICNTTNQTPQIHMGCGVIHNN